ncbi:hypothetical protein KC363_g5266 [Hortaea werneckii]|uniref:Uncharacterized protein n=1 Tax=Hortaea werneckii TaxID=91943 RepID=A0A3M7EZF3_HORWE|nr:hypothetical protein KC361_g3577 [Hortaea werneckii]KAI6877897.1 hypothetical protein KC325_g8969 [Hortaea werneckii]KAI6990336.1 hypothetical protein KC359_g6717 [Hortaea werneckii]KAI7143589.1 hypothetical protein KC344_g6153 [Hortaea werneckii]KAI7167241.1 hypothetical protein KC360_g8767 [Hortaea werneckii]
MQLAAFLSDLTSLQVCDPRAAMTLVTTRPSNVDTAETDTDSQDNDQDLKRAKDLLELHTSVKVAHQDGSMSGLNDARDAIAKVLREI